MAKYKIIPSSRTIVHSPISIGHKAEKSVEAIEFDLTAWVETYGSGTLTVIMRRWGDEIPYPVALELDENNKATWTLSDIDTAKAGMAYAQLSYIVGDTVVKKSDIYTFRVMDSLTGEGEPPEAYESWLEHLTHLAAEAMAEVLDIEGIVTDKTLTVDGGIADAKAAGDALALKADKSTTYTKTEVDQMIEDVEVETDTTLSVSGAPADAKKTGDELSALKADFEHLVIKNDAFDWSELGTVAKPTGWQRGYYTNEGIVTGSSSSYICTISSRLYKPDDNVLYFIISAPSSYAVSVCEYLENGTYLKTHGVPNSNLENSTNELTISHTPGHRYSFTVGRFTSSDDAGNHLTSEFVSTILLNSYSLNIRQETAPKDGDQVTIYNNFLSGYINTSGTSVDFNTVNEKENMYYTIIECESGDKFKIVAIGGNENRLQYVFTDSNGVILLKSGIYAESWDSWFKYYPDRIITAPNDAKYMIVHHYFNYCAYTPKVYKLAKNDSTNKDSAILPKSQFPSWKDKVHAVYKNMLVILDNNKFRLSTDCGDTWNEGVDVSSVSDISRAYLFANGDLAFYTNDKAYYIDNWSTYHEANFYEADGTTQYVPVNNEGNFWCQRTYNERKFIDGIDVYVFGNYHIEDTTRSIVWATFDRGKTYQIAWEFGSRETQTPTDSWKIRHVHSVYYYEPEDIYLVNTGDSNETECMLIGLKYDNEQWTATKIGGPDRDYKWTSIGYWEGQIYYSNDNTYGSIWRCSYEDLNDLTKHICVLDRMYNDSSFVIFGNNGEMICMTNTNRNTAGGNYPTPYTNREGARVFWFSSDRKNFHELHMPVTFLRGYCNITGGAFPVASDGKLFGVVRNGVLKTSLCLSDIVHEAGFKTAFCPRI